MLEFPISELQGHVEKVAFGRDRFYLEKAPDFDARALYGKPFQNPEFFARNWDPALTRIARLCREIGSRLIVIVAPDAHAVHPDGLPEHLSYHAPSIGEAFVAHLRDDLGIEALYPRDCLRAACGGPIEIYRRNDTHWSAYGAYIGYRLMFERLRALWPADHPRKPRPLTEDDVTYESRPMLGDLGWMSEPPFAAEQLLPRVATQRSHMTAHRTNEIRQAIVAYEVDDADLPSCVILRDSFATAMTPFLNESFRRIVYVGGGRNAFPELIRAERPDVVIIERGERAVVGGLSDWDFLSDREVLPRLADSDAEKLHNEARTLLAANKYDEAAQHVRRALETDGSPDLHFTLARIHMAALSFEEAEKALQAAIQGDGGRFSFRLFLGIAQLSLHRYADALASFGHAVVLDPEHPLGFEHFGYTAMLLADFAGAEAALAKAAKLWPEHPNVHLWRSVAFERDDKLEQALTAAREAAALAPDQSVFVDRVVELEKRIA